MGEAEGSLASFFVREKQSEQKTEAAGLSSGGNLLYIGGRIFFFNFLFILLVGGQFSWYEMKFPVINARDKQGYLFVFL